MNMHSMIDFYRDVLYDFFLDGYEGDNPEVDFETWVYDLDEDEVREITGEDR
jgi:hypothetical protein